MKNDSWMQNGSDSLAKSETSYEPSTGINQKRGHQMSMDSSEQEPFFSKKQAAESVNIGATSEAAILNDPLWSDASNDHLEGHTGDDFFIPEPVQTSNESDKNVPSIDSSSLNINTKDSGDQHGDDLTLFLSMHRSSEDPLCSKTGVRRVKVKEVTVSENCSSELEENLLCPQNKNEPRVENGMPSGYSYSTLYESPLIHPFSGTKNYIFSIGYASSETSGKIDGSYILDNQHCNCVNTALNWHQKENGNFLLVFPTHNHYHENFFTIYPFFNGSNEALHTNLFNSKEVNAINSMTSYQDHPESVVISLKFDPSTENSSPLPMSDKCENSEQTVIPFRGFSKNAEENDSSGGLVSSCVVLPFQTSGALGDADYAGQSLNLISASTSKIDGAQKKKERKLTKRTSRHNFPANVKSLLSTGILNGVPVKYVSWSRELTLRGVVHGNLYLCGCKECKLVKLVSAYEFESHAGCKSTKHPNNHIYFENGKSIYTVAQELKNTPREMLFDVLLNVTGSLVNQKNFEIWKESCKIPPCKLQRVSSKIDPSTPS